MSGDIVVEFVFSSWYIRLYARNSGEANGSRDNSSLGLKSDFLG